VAELWQWWQVTGMSPELQAGSGELGLVRREYNQGRAALTDASVDQCGRAGTRAGVHQRVTAVEHVAHCFCSCSNADRLQIFANLGKIIL
jgi:hypothetical protein